MCTARVLRNAAGTGVHQADRRRRIGVQIAEDCHRRIVANIDQASAVRRQLKAYEAVPHIRADDSAVDTHRYTRMRV